MVQVTVTDSKGLVQQSGRGMTIDSASNLNRGLKSTDRYYLEEFFYRRPCINADVQNGAEATRMIANSDFEVLGTNMTSALATFPGTHAGIKLTTAGADNDQAIVAPHLDTNQSAWTGCKWGTENQVEWETAVTTGSEITTQSFWAGLKLTNTGVYATDANQAYFLYASDDDQGALTTNANLHFVYSVAGTDYITDLGVAVAADTCYKLKISFDSDRKVSIFVNGEQYSLALTEVAGGPLSGKGTVKSLAMTDDIDLIPYVGLQSHDGSADHIYLHYEAINRVLFE